MVLKWWKASCLRRAEEGELREKEWGVLSVEACVQVTEKGEPFEQQPR